MSSVHKLLHQTQDAYKPAVGNYHKSSTLLKLPGRVRQIWLYESKQPTGPWAPNWASEDPASTTPPDMPLAMWQWLPASIWVPCIFCACRWSRLNSHFPAYSDENSSFLWWSMRPETSSLSLTWQPLAVSLQLPLLSPHHPALGSLTLRDPHQASGFTPSLSYSCSAWACLPWGFQCCLGHLFWSSGSKVQPTPYTCSSFPSPTSCSTQFFSIWPIITFFCLHLCIKSKPRVCTRGTK